MNQQQYELIKNIYEAIRSGEIVRSGQLFTERELCERFGVKRGVLQKALISLETIGVIESKERLGTVVVDRPEQLLSDSMPFLSSHSPLAIHNQAFDARLILEPQIAALAAQKCSPEQAALLDSEMSFLDELYADTVRSEKEKAELFYQHNIVFHNMIYDVVDNTVLSEINNYVSRLSRDIFTIVGRLPSGFQPYAVWPEELINEHKAIEKAITAHDPETASEMMRQHLLNSRTRNSDRISLPENTGK